MSVMFFPSMAAAHPLTSEPQEMPSK